MAFQLRRDLHGVVASTSPLAREAAEAGCDEGLVIQATRQTHGYGRRGRYWHSPPGNSPGNFYGSIVLRPRQPRAAWGGLSLVMALAVAETMEHYIYSVYSNNMYSDGDGGKASGKSPSKNTKHNAMVKVKVKWPNDVLVVHNVNNENNVNNVNNATSRKIASKIAGIILEASDDALIVGIGINLTAAPDTDVLGDHHLPAISLADIIPPQAMPSMDAFWLCLAGRVAENYTLWQQAGLNGVREAWLGRAYCLGEEVRMTHEGMPHHDIFRGIFRGIDLNGNMLLKQNDNTGNTGDTIRVISAGDCLPSIRHAGGAGDDKERHESYAACD
ncbi:MAG: biotin--[acetyl-CoA-carboxylase] ligase [Proteobacteria bacterium]|nr:biotin--[acetyl-CoA-carboxylase] ligase [Pseudomonadota bacterium]